jgi:hypothetical protein
MPQNQFVATLKKIDNFLSFFLKHQHSCHKNDTMSFGKTVSRSNALAESQ